MNEIFSRMPLKRAFWVGRGVAVGRLMESLNDEKIEFIKEIQSNFALAFL